MNREDFDAQGRKLAGSSEVVALLDAGFEVLCEQFLQQGLTVHPAQSGEFTHATMSFERYRGCLLEDPLFGPVVARLEFHVSWECATLTLSAYACKLGSRDPRAVAYPSLVNEPVATCWPNLPSLSMPDAQTRLQHWVSVNVGAPFAGAEDIARSFRARLDLVLAP
jgi:hypothetical protein